MDSVVVAALVAVVGWGITHGFTIRAQRKKFLDDIRNTSRLEISRALNDYIKWLNLFYEYIGYLELKFSHLRTMNIPIDWDDVNKKFSDINSNPPDSWDWLTEEYRIIFPETASLRVILNRRQFEIQSAYYWFKHSFWEEKVELDNLIHHRENTIKLLGNWKSYIQDQMCLVIDLQIHLQNKALSQIAGRKIPDREPKDANLCRVGENLKGDLIITDGLGNEVKQSKQPFSVIDIWELPIDDIHHRY